MAPGRGPNSELVVDADHQLLEDVASIVLRQAILLPAQPLPLEQLCTMIGL